MISILFNKQSFVHFLKKIFFLFLCFSIFKANAIDFPLLKVSDGRSSAFVIGSMHVGKIAEKYDEKLFEIIEKSNSICFEISPSEKEQAKKIATTLNFNQEDTTLKKRLGNLTFNRLSRRLPNLFVDGNTLPNASPFLMGNVLQFSPNNVSNFFSKYHPNSSLDFLIQQIAASKNKNIKSLESLDAVINVYFSISDNEWSEYIDGILDILDCPLCSEKYTENIIKAFTLSNDYEQAFSSLEEAFISSQKAFSVYKKFYFGNRNNGMANAIKNDVLGNNKCDVVVIGAGHLGGPNGIVNLLSKQGVKVEKAR